VTEDTSSELAFVKRLQARDERAFNELVEVFGPRIFHLVRRMLNRHEEAEDMAQEVFVQVFKCIGQFRADCKLSTWIYRIALNLTRNRVKYLARRKDDGRTELEPMAEHSPLASAPGVTQGELARPDEAVTGLQIERVVQRCLSELEPDFREVLVLRDIEDLSYDEIMEITGLAEGTVKSRLHRARAALKALVEQTLGEKLT
jgi:RNA polymerase sigma-70 factor (ECF subfamily)